MENEQMLSVLTEILEGQKVTLDAIKELREVVSQVSPKHTQSNLVPANDLEQNLKLDQISAQLSETKKILEQNPRVMKVEKKYLLFPEYNAKDHYAGVLKWILYILIATYCCWIIRYAIWIYSHH